MKRRIFIDANQLIQFGHGLKSAEARALHELVELGELKLITTDLTIREVAKRFAKNDLEKLQEVCKPDVRSRIKQYLGIELPEISREDIWGKTYDRHFREVSDYFEKVNTKVLKIETVSPMVVLEDYTHGRGLFSTSSKKDQFPDAFIFEALKSIASADQPLLVLSHDVDFKQACARTDHIRHVGSFQELLGEVGIESAGDAEYELIERFEEEFRGPVESALQEHFIYSDDVEDGEIEVISVEEITLESIKVYRSTLEPNSYLVYAKVSCKAKALFNHPDWDNAIWDSEDKVLIPFDTVEGAAEVEFESEPFTFTFIYDPEFDTAEVSNPQLRGSGYLSTSLYPREDF